MFFSHNFVRLVTCSAVLHPDVKPAWQSSNIRSTVGVIRLWRIFKVTLLAWLISAIVLWSAHLRDAFFGHLSTSSCFGISSHVIGKAGVEKTGGKSINSFSWRLLTTKITLHLTLMFYFSIVDDEKLVSSPFSPNWFSRSSVQNVELEPLSKNA